MIKNPPQILTMSGVGIERVSFFKLLGVTSHRLWSGTNMLQWSARKLPPRCTFERSSGVRVLARRTLCASTWHSSDPYFNMPVQYRTARSRRNCHPQSSHNRFVPCGSFTAMWNTTKFSRRQESPRYTTGARCSQVTSSVQSANHPAAFTISCPLDEWLKLFRGCELL